MNRRDFLKASAAATVALAVQAPNVIADDKAPRYKTVLIGSGWWGMNILHEAMASGLCDVAALCDVDENQLDKAAADVEKLSGAVPRKYNDFRDILAKEKPDIAIVATPDHWHPLVMIEAVKSGAHVYVEKPISHTLKEGRAMVAAARAADRIVQVGTHRRVSPHNISGREFIKSGKVGKIGMVRCFVHYPGGGPERVQPNSEPPKGLNWDMWCGPAPLRPYNRGIHPKGFRQYLDYANGQLGDWGIHWLDQVLWIMEQEAPSAVYTAGGRPIKGPPVNDERGQTSDAPDHQVSTFTFDNFTCTWEHRMFAGNNAEKTDPGQAVGCYFYGTNGTFHQGWLDGWTFYPSDAKKAPIHQPAQLNKPDDQNIKELFADFLASIAAKRKSLCDIEIGHRSTSMALLGMLSLKLGRSVKWDAGKEICTGDDEATALLSRKYRAPWVYPTA